MKNKRDEYIGMEQYNNQGCLMKIVDYNTYNDIKVEFAKPYNYTVKTGVGHFLDGTVKNPYFPTIYGVGIIGKKYPTIIKSTKKALKEYGIWYSMLRRCFSDNFKEKYPTYKDAICDPIWLKYENFYEWVHSQDNYEAIKNTDYNIDKDIICKGNLLYTPDKCTLVPSNLNKLLTKDNAKRGEYPIGVTFDKYSGYYAVYCNDGKKQIHVTNHSTIGESFLAYKKYKEDTIKRIAKEEYNKGTITEKCYTALMNYVVEITD